MTHDILLLWLNLGFGNKQPQESHDILQVLQTTKILKWTIAIIQRCRTNLAEIQSTVEIKLTIFALLNFSAETSDVNLFYLRVTQKEQKDEPYGGNLGITNSD